MKVKRIFFFVFSFSILLFLESCFGEDEVAIPPNEPIVLEFIDLSFHDSDRGADSLILTMSIQHKYDIGLPVTGSDLEFPFHQYDYVIDANGDSVTNRGEYVTPFFRLRPNGETLYLSDQDTRPGPGPDNSCEYFYYEYQSGKEYFIVENPYYPNIIINFIGVARSATKLLNTCVRLNTRIPLVSSNKGRYTAGPFNFKITNKYQFELTYIMTSQWPVILKNDTFAIEFFVIDQMLNTSDTIRTPFSTLRELEE